MAYKDLLVELTSYPERTSNAGIEQATSVAALLGAHLSAITFEIEIPQVANSLARSFLNIDDMIAGERQKGTVKLSENATSIPGTVLNQAALAAPVTSAQAWNARARAKR